MIETIAYAALNRRLNIYDWVGGAAGLLCLVVILSDLGTPSQVVNAVGMLLGFDVDDHTGAIHGWLNDDVRRSLLLWVTSLALLVNVISYIWFDTAEPDELRTLSQIEDEGERRRQRDEYRQYAGGRRLRSSVSVWIVLVPFLEMVALPDWWDSAVGSTLLLGYILALGLRREFTESLREFFAWSLLHMVFPPRSPVDAASVEGRQRATDGA